MTPSHQTNAAPAPCRPRRAPYVAGAVLLCALSYIVASLFGGVPRVAFTTLGVLDFVAGAQVVARWPFAAWALWGLVLGATLGFVLDAPLYGWRRQRFAFLAIPTVLLLCGACTAYFLSPTVPWPPDPVAPVAPPPPAPNFAGTWDTGRWGTMELQQDGNHVFGTYTYSNGVIEGTVAPVNGVSRLTYRWRNQQGGASGVGYFDLDAAAKNFNGEWVNGELLNRNGQDWSGSRTAPAPPPASFTGTWATEWGEMQLHQGVKTVTGTYEYGAGILRGNLDGGTLRFHWVNRVTGEEGAGKFTLATYGQAFQGTWNKTNDPDAAGEKWTGTRKVDGAE